MNRIQKNIIARQAAAFRKELKRVKEHSNVTIRKYRTDKDSELTALVRERIIQQCAWFGNCYNKLAGQSDAKLAKILRGYLRKDYQYLCAGAYSENDKVVSRYSTTAIRYTLGYFDTKVFFSKAAGVKPPKIVEDYLNSDEI